MRKTGHYERIASVDYFIPSPLPPKDPPLLLNAELVELFGQAMLELGMLNGMVQKLSDIQRFIKAYVTKEALLSSAIEGIHTTMIDVFTQPLIESKPSKNTQLVLNYNTALFEAVSLMRKQGLPIASRLLCAAHYTLMQNGDGGKADPGNFRRQSVKVGNLIPPPSLNIKDLMTDLSAYINTNDGLPLLIKAGLVHVQFETIHPFLDGNGRIGRMLIVLMLVDSGLLTEPILYPSYYFKKHQSEYYKHLDSVRTDGDFEGWIKFYLTAVKESCIDAFRRVQDIENLNIEIITQLEQIYSVKAKGIRLRALNALFSFPIVSIIQLATHLEISYNSAKKIIDEFIDLKILTELSLQKRNKIYKFESYMIALERVY